jgi:hypothetical protein
MSDYTRSELMESEARILRTVIRLAGGAVVIAIVLLLSYCATALAVGIQ